MAGFCVVLPAAVLVACGGSEGGTALPGVVATTTVVSTVSGPPITAAPVTSVVTSVASTSITVRTTVVQPTTVTATVTKAPVVRPTAVRSTTQSAPPDSTRWNRMPNSDGVNDDVPFPSSLPGWTMTTNWQAGPRAFNNGWTPATGPDGGRFPSTMNGCDDQRFLVRWHVRGAQVRAAWADAAGDRHDQVTGNNGWFDLDGCGNPEFQALAADGGIADVSVDVQQYSAG